MSKEELTKKINNFLDQSPFDDREIKMWQGKMLKMNEADLSELYSLLQEKLKILTESNQLLINIAEDIVKDQGKEAAEIPGKINFIDLPIATVAKIINKDLTRYLKSKKTDIVVLLDDYFKEAFANSENVVDEFDVLIKAITANNEFLDNKRKITISQWLKLYNQANESRRRKNIDRINFINQSGEAKKLSKEVMEYLLNLLKLYDYLLDPENVLMALNKTEKKAVAGVPRKVVSRNLSESENNLAELKQLAANYPPGSLERKAVEEEIEKLEVRS